MATEHAGMSPWPSWIGEASLPLLGQLRATGEGAPTRHSRGACRYDAMAMEISGRFLAIAKPRGSTVEGSAAIATSWRRGVGMSCRMTIGEVYMNPIKENEETLPLIFLARVIHARLPIVWWWERTR